MAEEHYPTYGAYVIRKYRDEMHEKMLLHRSPKPESHAKIHMVGRALMMATWAILIAIWVLLGLVFIGAVVWTILGYLFHMIPT